MSSRRVTRRRFLKGLAAAAGGTVLAACTPQVVEKVVEKPVIQTVVVEKAVEVEKIATVLVERAVEVEKRVVETVVVEKVVVQEKAVEVEKLVTAVPAAVGPVELSLLVPYWAGAWQEGLDAVIRAFERMTGNTAKLAFGTQEQDQNAKLLADIAAGTPPDVYYVMMQNAGLLMMQGVFAALDDAFAAAGLKQSDFIRCDILPCTYGGRLWGVPFMDGQALSTPIEYRIDFFDEAGIDAPPPQGSVESYDALWELAAKLQKTDASGKVSRWGWSHRNGQHCGVRLLGPIKELGGSWWDESKQELTLATDEVATAIQKVFLDPIFTYGVSWVPGSPDEPDLPHPAYGPAEGVTAMCDFIYNKLRECGKEDLTVCDLLGFFEVPPIVEGVTERQVAAQTPWAMTVPKTVPADHMEAAGQYVTTHIVDREATRALHAAIGVPVGYKPYGKDPFWEEMKQKSAVHKFRAEYLQGALFEDFYLPMTWEWGQMDSVYWFCRNRCTELGGEERCEETGHWMSGNLTAEQLAEEWNEAANARRTDFLAKGGLS